MSRINEFISNYDISLYSGKKKILLDDKKLSINKIAKQILEAFQNDKLTVEQAKSAREKLSQMKVQRANYKLQKIGASFQPEKSKGIAQTQMTILALEKRISGIETAVGENEREELDSLIGKFDCHIDSLFTSLPLPSNQTLLIHVREDNGLGDIMLCVKTVKALQQKFPNLEIQISIETRTLTSQDVIRKISGECPQIKALFPYNRRPTDLRDPTLLIIMPTKPLIDVEKFLDTFKTPPERLLLQEYGWGEALQSGGLSDCSLGIFLEQLKSGTKTSGRGIAKLSNNQIKKLILGTDPSHYSKKNRLYFGYAHTPQATAGFIKAIVLLNEGADKNIDFFLRTENYIPGIDWQMEVTNEALNCTEKVGIKMKIQDDIPYAMLAENGIVQIEIIKIKRRRTFVNIETPHGLEKKEKLVPKTNPDGTFQIETKVQKIPGANGNKNLRILDLFPLSHGDMLLLNQASEPEMLVTGNQSFGEAVSSKKCFFYEALPNDYDFAAQMGLLGGKISPKLQSAIELMQFTNAKMDPSGIALLLKNPEIQKGFVLFGEKIRNEFDLAIRLELKVKRMAWARHSPNIGRHLKPIEEKIEGLSKERAKKRDVRDSQTHGSKVHDPVPADPEDFAILLTATASDVVAIQEEIAQVKRE